MPHSFYGNMLDTVFSSANLCADEQKLNLGLLGSQFVLQSRIDPVRAKSDNGGSRREE